MSYEDNDEARPGCLIWMVVGILIIVAIDIGTRLGQLETRVRQLDSQCKGAP